MRRRKFLGFMGGAVAAGPKLASGIAEDAVSGNTLSSVAAGFGHAIPTSDDSWKTDEIKRLKSILRLGDPRRPAEEKGLRINTLEAFERYRLDGLRSVSPSHKQRMLMERRLEINHENQRHWLEQRLNELLTGNQ